SVLYPPCSLFSRLLHSFPTRRSSDLTVNGSARLNVSAGPAAAGAGSMAHPSPPHGTPADPPAGLAIAAVREVRARKSVPGNGTGPATDRVCAMSRSRTHLGNVVRGGLIGTAEAIPGVSGGTVALVTGVYETIIASAGHLVSAGRAVFRDRARAREEFRQVRWDVLIPLAVGMVPALIV